MAASSTGRFITLQELCELLGISKATFYKHHRQGVFPEPLRTGGGRLVFDLALVERCQQVVRTRTGVNGEPVIFQLRKTSVAGSQKAGTRKPSGQHEELIKSLASLGLTATAEQIDQVVKELPADLSEPERLRKVFLLLRKQS